MLINYIVQYNVYLFLYNQQRLETWRLGELGGAWRKYKKEDLQDRLKVDREDTECFKRP